MFFSFDAISTFHDFSQSTTKKKKKQNSLTETITSLTFYHKNKTIYHYKKKQLKRILEKSIQKTPYENKLKKNKQNKVAHINTIIAK